MDQDSFRNLLNSDELKKRPNTKGFSVKDVNSLDAERRRELKKKATAAVDKKKQGQASDKKSDIAKVVYRDRAGERREISQDQDDDEGEKYSVEKSKFLGGDMERTHLVRGLDFTLLRKVRDDISGNGNVTAAAAPKQSRWKDDNSSSLPSVSMPIPANIPGLRTSLPLPPGVPGATAATAVPNQKKPAREKEGLRSGTLLSSIQNRIPSYRANSQTDANWIHRLCNLTLQPPHEQTHSQSEDPKSKSKSKSLKVMPTWEDTSSGYSKHGKALRRIVYEFSMTFKHNQSNNYNNNNNHNHNKEPIQSLITFKPAILSEMKKPIFAPVEVALLQRIKNALIATTIVNKGDSKKKRKHPTIETDVSVPKATDTSTMNYNDNDDDDIFAGMDAYVPTGALQKDEIRSSSSVAKSVFDGISVISTTNSGTGTETGTGAAADAILAKFIKNSQNRNKNSGRNDDDGYCYGDGDGDGIMRDSDSDSGDDDSNNNSNTHRKKRLKTS
jgi:hypothetical protein